MLVADPDGRRGAEDHRFWRGQGTDRATQLHRADALHAELGRPDRHAGVREPGVAGRLRPARDVDTRPTYSLGVILYQLLVRVLPFEPKEPRSAGIDGILKMIREVEPPSRALRLSTLGSERSTLDLPPGTGGSTCPRCDDNSGDLD